MLIPKLESESIKVGYSIRWNSNDAAILALITSGMNELSCPTDCPQKAIAKNTLKQQMYYDIREGSFSIKDF